MRKLLFALLIIALFTGTVTLLTIFLTGNQQIPVGVEGAGAQELATRLEQSVHLQEWKGLGAVEFVFQPARTHHFHDLKRGFVEVSYPTGSGRTRVLYSRKNGAFIAWQEGALLEGEEAQEALKEARKFHNHALFWLNPFATLRNPGVVLKKVGARALLAIYPDEEGGEGNSYLIVLDRKGKPEHWKMWVDYTRIKGVEVTFDGWESLTTGALVSLKRKSLLRDLNLEVLESYETYPVPGDTDRFAPLVKRINHQE